MKTIKRNKILVFKQNNKFLILLKKNNNELICIMSASSARSGVEKGSNFMYITVVDEVARRLELL